MRPCGRRRTASGFGDERQAGRGGGRSERKPARYRNIRKIGRELQEQKENNLSVSRLAASGANYGDN